MSKRKIEPDSLEISKNKFREELLKQVIFHCHCINHYVAGCDSPFGYLQISDVQEKLREIEDILGIEAE